MISRIRLDAFGYEAGEVANTLSSHADEIEKLLGKCVARGECVIERDLPEPDGSRQAFKGRMLLYPDVSPPSPGITLSSATNMQWVTTGGNSTTG